MYELALLYNDSSSSEIPTLTTQLEVYDSVHATESSNIVQYIHHTK